MRRPLLVALLALSLSALVGLPTALTLTQASTTADVGTTQVSAADGALADGASAGTTRPPARVTDPPEDPADADDAADADEAADADDEPDEPTPASPAEVRVDALDLHATVDPVGIRDDGAMGVPDDVDVAGWFAPGVAPGHDSGSAVLAAHVDSREQGLGQFAALHEAQPGQDVEVTDADGQTWRYEVTGRTQQPKASLDTDAVFRHRGDHVLTLITCGGAWDDSQGRYADNVLVEATPTW